MATLTNDKINWAQIAPIEEELNMPEDSLIEVFKFDTEWQRILPHLRKPEVEGALEDGMNAYRAMRHRLCEAGGQCSTGWQKPYNPDNGPLDNDSTTYWMDTANQMVQEAVAQGRIEFTWPADENDSEAMQKAFDKWGELESQFYPKRDTMEWYQLHDAAHYLAPWLTILGKCLYPELEWRIMAGDCHSFAYGADKVGRIKRIFDITLFNWPPIHLIELATRECSGPPTDWSAEVNARPIAGFFEKFIEGKAQQLSQ